MTLFLNAVTLAWMQIERAQELLRAATLCLEAGLLNSAASRAFYAMFQGAQVALVESVLADRRGVILYCKRP